MALGDRLSLAVQLLGATPDTTGKMVGEFTEVARVLAVVGKTIPLAHKIGRQLRAFLVLAQNRGNHSRPERVSASMSRLAGDLRTLVSEIQSILGNVAYPFPHPRGNLTIVEYARYEKTCDNDFETAYQQGNSHLDRLFALHYRIVGRLLVLAEKLESELEKDVSEQAS